MEWKKIIRSFLIFGLCLGVFGFEGATKVRVDAAEEVKEDLKIIEDEVYKFDFENKEIQNIFNNTTVEAFNFNLNEGFYARIYENMDAVEQVTGETVIKEGMKIIVLKTQSNEEVGVFRVAKMKSIALGGKNMSRSATNTPHHFYSITINKAIDVDGMYGAQCFDLFNYFTMFYHNGVRIGGVGAKDIFLNRNTNGVLRYFDVVPLNAMKDGDWVIWGGNGTNGGYGHVGMYRKDNGNGTGLFLNQNYAGRKYTTQNNISYSGAIGALRPKVFNGGGTVVPPTAGTNYGALDAVTANLNVLSVSGWHVTTKLQPATPTDRVSNSRYLFVMDANTGGELGRFAIDQVWRQDVANVYAGTIRNGGYGGFNLSVPMQSNCYGKRIYFMTRYANDYGGDHLIDDYSFGSNVYTVPVPQDLNAGALDVLSASSTVISGGGWHVTGKLQPATPTDRVSNSRFVFIMDADTGLELGRFAIDQEWRQDVANIYANTIRNGGYGGFTFSVPVQEGWKGKRISIMTRYANDYLGNGLIEDFHFGHKVVTIPR